MLSIQGVRGLPSLHAPDIVPLPLIFNLVDNWVHLYMYILTKNESWQLQCRDNVGTSAVFRIIVEHARSPGSRTAASYDRDRRPAQNDRYISDFPLTSLYV